MVRARLQVSDDQVRVLFIRVGEGEVEGVLCNTIAPDIRTWSTVEAVDLIIDRLISINPSLVRESTDEASDGGWPTAAARASLAPRRSRGRTYCVCSAYHRRQPGAASLLALTHARTECD